MYPIMLQNKKNKNKITYQKENKKIDSSTDTYSYLVHML